MEYKRIVICELCGHRFEVTNKYNRSKRCPECRRSIRSGIRQKETTNKEKTCVSNLDTLAREAKKYGLTYGKYVGLKRAGYKMMHKHSKKTITHSWDEWIADLYRIVDAGKERVYTQHQYQNVSDLDALDYR